MYGHVIAKCSRMGSLAHFLTHSTPLRETSAINAPPELKIKGNFLNLVCDVPTLDTNSVREMALESSCLCSGALSPSTILHLSNCAL